MNDSHINCSTISLSHSFLNQFFFSLIVNQYTFIIENVEKTENDAMVFNTQIKTVRNPTDRIIAINIRYTALWLFFLYIHRYTRFLTKLGHTIYF